MSEQTIIRLTTDIRFSKEELQEMCRTLILTIGVLEPNLVEHIQTISRDRKDDDGRALART
jgi:hypothetical protein